MSDTAEMTDIVEPTEEFNPKWTLTSVEELAVALSIAMAKHISGWPGATDDELEAAATDIFAGAADTITALRAKVAALEGALRPFADFKFEMVSDFVGGDDDEAVVSIEADDGSVVLSEIRNEHFLAARSILSSTEGKT